MYTGAAQYDDPQEYPVNKACEGIDGDSEGTYTLGRIFSGIVALRGENSCHDVDEFFSDETLDSSWGWQDIRVVLKRFGSNIIFSNGHRDPCSSAGVLENISDNIIAVTTKNSSHCLDIQPATEDDPEWLVMQRKIEMDMVHDWFLKYSADLLQN
ncbi:prolylcarboxypeptidase-like protein [Citrus sinensis]|nr:prolylcarboxypeptidase-like protein [Citrus sinensis]